MTTPTEPTAWAAWEARAMQLAELYAGWTAAVANYDDELHIRNRDAARAALAAHLAEVPMGPPVVWLRECAVLSTSAAQRVHATQADANDVAQMYRDDGYECAVVPLYRHPKELA